MTNETFETLADKVRVWASDRQILEHSTAYAQLVKTDEERKETMQALEACIFEYPDENPEVVDGYGDMLVTVIVSAAIAGVDPVEALAHAYDQIKDRRGYLNSAGIFVKDE